MSNSSGVPADPPADAPQSSEGVALVHQGASASAATVTQQQPLDLLSLKNWAVILLGRVQDGDTVDQARERSGSKVSRESISLYGQLHPAWYRALMDAQDASRDGEPVTSRDVARALAVKEGLRRHTLAMEAKRDSDAIAAMRLGAEIRGDVGQGAQVAVQVNTTIQVPMHPDTTPRRGQVVDAATGHKPNSAKLHDDTPPPA